ncbi:inositol-3-phosphate synthase [Aureococcus anophagefferens]|nr:inositol-3-phosphate synthase [Aureococcus anophagefferens]
MAVAVPTLARLLALLAAHHATARIGTHARPLQLRGGAKKLRGGSEDEAPAPRKVGCLIVGLGGNNGCTVLAGLVANRRRLAWEGQKRRIDADWGGCLTQRGDLAEKMASFEHAAVGGWDVRPTKLGAALLAARIVDTDLARLVEAELDAVEVMPGVYDERYVGESQRATATHTKQGLATAKEKVDALRADIRRFKEAHGVDGHCTVIWSRPSVNERARTALGTDFKAGQTKFKTCAVEYLENNGFTVKVVASSNHLGNNDMRNLALGTPTQARTNAAKLRVKSSIFKPGVDHHVSVQYAPFIGDEKRDFVEYTSEAFLGQLHTMATYTRCSDSVLCAPLLVDATVLLDFFATHAVAPAEVAEATAYLFKVPEGRAKAEAQGFHAQLDTMKRTVAAVEAAEEDVEALVEEVEALVVDKEEPLVEQEDGNEAPAEREAEDTPKPEEAPSKPAVVCCGLACLDLELGGASDGGREAINGFEAATSRAGGSAPQAASALADHGVAAVAVAPIAGDAQGDELARLLLDKGVRVDAPPRFDAARTGLAVVPVFSDGGRGCYFGAGANADFGGEDVVEGVARQVARGGVLAVHVGYPHLLPRLRASGCGRAVASWLAPNALISWTSTASGPGTAWATASSTTVWGGGPGALPRRGAPRGVEFADELEARGDGRASCPGPARPTRTAPATRYAQASSPPSSPATAP